MPILSLCIDSPRNRQFILVLGVSLNEMCKSGDENTPCSVKKHVNLHHDRHNLVQAAEDGTLDAAHIVDHITYHLVIFCDQICILVVR